VGVEPGGSGTNPACGGCHAAGGGGGGGFGGRDAGAEEAEGVTGAAAYGDVAVFDEAEGGVECGVFGRTEVGAGGGPG